MVHFVGAGSGAPDLITLRGAELLKTADVVIYAGSLVNPALLGLCRAEVRLPLVPLQPDSRERLQSLLARHGLLPA